MEQRAIHGLEGGVGFGRQLAAVADLDGDGVAELLVGASNSSHVHPFGGAAFLFSGRTGALRFAWYGETPSTLFGDSVDRAGDVNADGYDDVLVGAPAAGGSGRVYVFSGKDGHRLFRIEGNPFGQGRMGESVSALGDVNFDGFDDFAAGDPDREGPPLSIGVAWIFSGKDGSVLRALRSPGDLYIGGLVRGIGDVDGDAAPDLLVSALGYVVLYSGATGQEIRRHVWNYSRFGVFQGEYCDVGDVDGDGTTDYAIGIPAHDDYGRVYLFSGTTGALLRTWVGHQVDSDFGEAVTGPGDLDGDGYPEILVGAYNEKTLVNSHAGAAYVFSTFDGGLLAEFRGEEAHEWRIGAAFAASRNAMPDAPLNFSIGSDSSTHGLIANGVVLTYALDSYLDLRPGAVSAAAGGPVGLEVDFPPSESGRRYSILVSSGAGRFRVGDVWIPLGRTPLLAHSAFGAPGAFHGQHGTLDFHGDARANFSLAPGAATPWIGRTLKFCALTHDPAGGVGLHSAAMPLTIGP